jgi:hypothetical protein
VVSREIAGIVKLFTKSAKRNVFCKRRTAGIPKAWSSANEIA